MAAGAHAAGADAAGGGEAEHHEQPLPEGVDVAQLSDVDKQRLLQQALRDVEVFTERARRADEERRRCLEASRTLQGSIRILGRVRPPLEDEADQSMCLRVQSRNQLEVLMQPRALLTEQPGAGGGARGGGLGVAAVAGSAKARRCSTGGIGVKIDGGGAGGCLGAFSEAPVTPAVCVEPPPADVAKVPLEPRAYIFDDLFDAGADDDAIFASVREELTAASEGEAVCILAYGATGSGKTHTVMNLAERAAQELERQAVALGVGGMELDIKVQLVEIYNQQLRDLLASDNGGKHGEPPQLKLSTTSSSSSTTLLGAAVRNICSRTGGGIAASLQEALRFGQSQRATSATAVHARSSRSHLVMTLFLTIREASSGCILRSGKLSLVDLAGSERLKRSEAVGERLKEAQHINRSLSALADVISAKERRVAHVPYRNSKLTHLLQDALGGQQQCRTVIIVALTPTWSSLNDTLHSLQFSSRLTALSLPAVVSRRSLRAPGSNSNSGQLQSGRPAGLDRYGGAAIEEEKGLLKQEASKWRQEFERAQAQLEEYRRTLETKDKQLEAAQKRNAELLASSQNFERNRERLFQGFAALDRRLQEVEATTAAASVATEWAHSTASAPPERRRGGPQATTRAGAAADRKPRPRGQHARAVAQEAPAGQPAAGAADVARASSGAGASKPSPGGPAEQTSERQRRLECEEAPAAVGGAEALSPLPFSRRDDRPSPAREGAGDVAGGSSPASASTSSSSDGEGLSPKGQNSMHSPVAGAASCGACGAHAARIGCRACGDGDACVACSACGACGAPLATTRVTTSGATFAAYDLSPQGSQRQSGPSASDSDCGQGPSMSCWLSPSPRNALATQAPSPDGGQDGAVPVYALSPRAERRVWGAPPLPRSRPSSPPRRMGSPRDDRCSDVAASPSASPKIDGDGAAGGEPQQRAVGDAGATAATRRTGMPAGELVWLPAAAGSVCSASSAVPTPRTRSGSAGARRRGNTPRRGIQREYVVEVISEAQASRLAAQAQRAEQRPLAMLGSPKLLLHPTDEDGAAAQRRGASPCAEEAACAEDCDSDGGCSSISTSSDEGVIRDRLRQTLKLQDADGEPCEAPRPPPAGRPQSPQHREAHATGGGAPHGRSSSVGREPGRATPGRFGIRPGSGCPASMAAAAARRGRDAEAARSCSAGRGAPHTARAPVTAASRSPSRPQPGRIGLATRAASPPPRSGGHSHSVGHAAPALGLAARAMRTASSSSPVRQVARLQHHVQQPMSWSQHSTAQPMAYRPVGRGVGGGAVGRSASGPGRGLASSARQQLLVAASPVARGAALPQQRQFAPVLSRRALDAPTASEQLQAGFRR